MTRTEARKLLADMEARARADAEVADAVLPWIDFAQTLVTRLEDTEIRAEKIIRGMLERGALLDDDVCFWCANKLEDVTQHEDDCVGEAARKWLPPTEGSHP